VIDEKATMYTAFIMGAASLAEIVAEANRKLTVTCLTMLKESEK
jgi:hypothetical protein